MEVKPATASASDNGMNKRPLVGRRRRKSNEETSARFFLPKEGSTLKTPELGAEMTNEGEALIEAFKRDQPFFVLTAWRAVPQQNGGDPVITKQPAPETSTE